MRTYNSIRSVAFWMAFAASGATLAATPAAPAAPEAQQPQGMMGGGMMGGKMMDGHMMDMMHSCQSMMDGGSTMSCMGMPKLPPGNEKLEVQMHAEMMQKMGEIAARYADRIK